MTSKLKDKDKHDLVSDAIIEWHSNFPDSPKKIVARRNVDSRGWTTLDMFCIRFSERLCRQHPNIELEIDRRGDDIVAIIKRIA